MENKEVFIDIAEFHQESLKNGYYSYIRSKILNEIHSKIDTPEFNDFACKTAYKDTMKQHPEYSNIPKVSTYSFMKRALGQVKSLIKSNIWE